MISPSDHRVRNAVMRRNVVEQLKRKHMHDFKRHAKDEILKDRESQSELDRAGGASTADGTPASRKMVYEREARHQFTRYVATLVSKKSGESSVKKNDKVERAARRISAAINHTADDSKAV